MPEVVYCVTGLFVFLSDPVSCKRSDMVVVHRLGDANRCVALRCNHPEMGDLSKLFADQGWGWDVVEESHLAPE